MRCLKLTSRIWESVGTCSTRVLCCFLDGPIFKTSCRNEYPAAQSARADRAADFRRSGATQPEADFRTYEDVGSKRAWRIGLAGDEIIRGRSGHTHQSSN